MSTAQCDYPGCTLPISLRCDSCRKSFCIRHSTTETRGEAPYRTVVTICDLCGEREAQQRRVVKEAGDRQANVGCWISVIALVLVIVGIVAGGTKDNIAAGVLAYGAGAFVIIGFIISIAGSNKS